MSHVDAWVRWGLTAPKTNRQPPKLCFWLEAIVKLGRPKLSLLRADITLRGPKTVLASICYKQHFDARPGSEGFKNENY